jgi:hypothetical protein
MIKKELTYGIRQVVYNFKFALLFFAVNFLVAAILSIGVWADLNSNLSHSILSQKLAIASDFSWYLQFRHLFAPELNNLTYSLIVSIVLYVLIQTYFSAGIVAVFKEPKKNHIIDFFYGGVKYWSRFLKISLVSIILVALAFILNDFFGQLLFNIFKNSDNALWDFIFRSLRYFVLITLLITITLFADYAKVSSAVDNVTSLRKTIINSAVFIKENFLYSFSLFMLISIIGLLGAIVYNIIGNFVGRSPYTYIIITFTLQQLLIIFRFGIKMLFVSVEVNLYKDLSADIIPVQAVEQPIVTGD